MTSTDDLSSNGAHNNLAKVPLAGYTDRLSTRPGDIVNFCLSATRERTQEVEVRARLMSSICADPFTISSESRTWRARFQAIFRLESI